MNTRRMAVKRLGEERMIEEIPYQVKKVPEDGKGVQGAQGDHVPNMEGGNEYPSELSNRDIREALLALARVVTTQVNLSMVPRVNVEESTRRLG